MITYLCLRVGQISLRDGALVKYGEAGGRYSDLFVGALRQYGMLSIGLNRSQWVTLQERRPFCAHLNITFSRTNIN